MMRFGWQMIDAVCTPKRDLELCFRLDEECPLLVCLPQCITTPTYLYARWPALFPTTFLTRKTKTCSLELVDKFRRDPARCASNVTERYCWAFSWDYNPLDVLNLNDAHKDNLAIESVSGTEGVNIYFKPAFSSELAISCRGCVGPWRRSGSIHARINAAARLRRAAVEKQLCRYRASKRYLDLRFDRA
ncbi:hypothetical protein BDZ45DRAFT_474806 [Acephala macrosclerotiorum]|nr:hypothetical protein BDZ45DRAFT_474806 [Acephala macrosclerotiorum]